MSRIILITSLLFSLALNACLQTNPKQPHGSMQHEPGYFIDANGDTIQMVIKSEEQWKAQLEPLAYEVLRQKGTERAFTGKFADHHEHGIYTCNGCGLPLFSSDTKFESGTGWPSFYKPLDKTHVLEETDSSYGMRRVEVMCHRCGGHLGHVFDDGPAPTGLRYCMNSISLAFQPE